MIDNIFFCTIAIIFLVLIICILRGATLWDKVLAANLCSSITAMAILLFSVVTGIDYYVDVALVFVLVGFVGTQFYSLFISKLGKF